MAVVVGKRGTTWMKPSMKPGNIAIIVRGEYAGKRVAIVSILERGLVVVASPIGKEKVPLMTISQKFLIGTSTNLNLKVDTSKITNDLFKKTKKEQSEEYKTVAAKIASEVESAVKKEGPIMEEYMSCYFSLNNAFKIPPHALKF